MRDASSRSTTSIGIPQIKACRMNSWTRSSSSLIFLPTWTAFYGRAAMKPIFIGIMPQEKIRERVLAIARGIYKPKPNEPKVWFTSMKSLAEVLSDENRALLRAILETQPQSISALAIATGRKPSNLSRTLKTMSNYGIVDLKRERSQVRPVAKATEFRIVA